MAVARNRMWKEKAKEILSEWERKLGYKLKRATWIPIVTWWGGIADYEYECPYCEESGWAEPEAEYSLGEGRVLRLYRCTGCNKVGFVIFKRVKGK